MALLLALFTLGLTQDPNVCYPVQCDDDGTITEVGVCMEFHTFSSTYKIKECGEDYTCPNPKYYHDTQQMYCQYWTDKRLWTSSSISDYYGYAKLSKGDSCDPNGQVNIWDMEDLLQCYCTEDNDNWTWVDGIDFGDACLTDQWAPPCIPGFVWSTDICTKKYTKLAEDRATNELACATGGPLVFEGAVNVCRPISATVGTLPKECNSDDDCTATDGAAGKWVCGFNTLGKSYCELHFSDTPNVNLRESKRDADWNSAVYWSFVVANWPYLQGDIPTWLNDIWEDYNEYLKGEPDSTSITDASTFAQHLGILLLIKLFF